jgi:hypothetical protein
VVDSSNQLVDRTVQLGLQTPTDAEVVSGLQEGEEVVVSDRSGLKPGERVVPKTVQIMQYHENNEE